MSKQDRIGFELENDRILVWSFPDGLRVMFDPLQLTTNRVELGQQAMVHGFKQKIADAAAMSMVTEKDGKVRRPTMEEKAKAMIAVVERLYAGEWNAERDGVPTGGLLFRAMQRLKPDVWENAADFRQWLEAQSAKRNVKVSVIESSLRRAPAVSAMIDEIRLEDGKSSPVDGDELLSEL